MTGPSPLPALPVPTLPRCSGRGPFFCRAHVPVGRGARRRRAGGSGQGAPFPATPVAGGAGRAGRFREHPVYPVIARPGRRRSVVSLPRGDQ